MRLFLLVVGIAVLGWMHQWPPRPAGPTAQPILAAATTPAPRAAALMTPVLPMAAVSQPIRVPEPQAAPKEAAPKADAAPTPVSAPAAAAATAPQLSDAEIARRIVARVAVWSAGVCRCPDDTDKRRRRCGKRSLYSRAGAAERPICYEKDVPAAMIERYRNVKVATSR